MYYEKIKNADDKRRVHEYVEKVIKKEYKEADDIYRDLSQKDKSIGDDILNNICDKDKGNA
jgi:hypothetical protein